MENAVGLTKFQEIKRFNEFEKDVLASTGYISLGQLAIDLGYTPITETLEMIAKQKAEDYGYNLKELFNDMGYLQDTDKP